MGSSLGPTLANRLMCYHESIWLQNGPDNFKPIIYKRYVGDIFFTNCIRKNNCTIESTDPHHGPNSQHGNLRFACKLSCLSLPFLDRKICFWELFSHERLQKPTFSGAGKSYFTPRTAWPSPECLEHRLKCLTQNPIV